VGTGFSSVVVADGRLFTMGWADGKDTVHCLEAATGDTRWTRSYPQATGEMKWGEKGELSIVRASPAKFELLARTQAIGGKCWTSPALAAGRLYIRNAKGELVCLDLRPRTKAQS
jgi:outer membrane protein assembly factor BamB